MFPSLRIRPSAPPSNNHIRLQPPPTVFRPPQCALTKQGERFLFSLAAVADDSTAANRLIRKFISGTPKAVALTTLSHLLAPNSSNPSHLALLALPMYRRMTEESWFDWNPKLVAELIALLESQSRFEEVEVLISEAVLKMGFKERELVMFYSNLIDSQYKQKLELNGVFDAEGKLKEMILQSKSVYVKQRAYEALIGALSGTERVAEAEELIKEMRKEGMKVGVFELRSVMYGYGRLGMFEEMKRSVEVMENEGFEIDTVCSNMVLSAYGARREFKEMAAWVRRMKESDVGLSIRTYNSVLNSCEKVMELVKDFGNMPLSLEELMEVVEGDEALLVQELMDSGVLNAAMEWSSREGKLDLHGMHLGSAYLILLQWMEELRLIWGEREGMVPVEVVVVCGLGKHSISRGESPVKELVKAMMVRMGSPLRLDRKNAGCFIAKGKAVKTWLC